MALLVNTDIRFLISVHCSHRGQNLSTVSHPSKNIFTVWLLQENMMICLPSLSPGLSWMPKLMLSITLLIEYSLKYILILPTRSVRCWVFLWRFLIPIWQQRCALWLWLNLALIIRAIFHQCYVTLLRRSIIFGRHSGQNLPSMSRNFFADSILLLLLWQSRNLLVSFNDAHFYDWMYL